MGFRTATQADVRWPASVNHQLIRDEGHSNPMNEPQLAERMAAWLKGEYDVIIFARDGTDVGYVVYRSETNGVYLRQLFVCRGCRRQGIGREAIAWLKSHRWMHAPRIRADVLVNNHAAHAFWRSVGFSDYCMTMEMKGTER
jgi:GNAT superfamily N-acetyltransferase